MKCKLCGKNYRHLGSHLWHRHRILADEYKMEFELPLNYSLIDKSIKEKKQIAFEKDREKYLKNFKEGKKYQFKKGRIPTKGYLSAYSKKKALIEILKVNKRKKKLSVCPVCKMRSHHLESHLYNKHKLLKV